MTKLFNNIITYYLLAQYIQVVALVQTLISSKYIPNLTIYVVYIICCFLVRVVLEFAVKGAQQYRITAVLQSLVPLVIGDEATAAAATTTLALVEKKPA